MDEAEDIALRTVKSKYKRPQRNAYQVDILKLAAAYKPPIRPPKSRVKVSATITRNTQYRPSNKPIESSSCTRDNWDNVYKFIFPVMINS